MVTLDLFREISSKPWRERLSPGATILRGFALADEPALLAALASVTAAAPFRHMETPGGFKMKVAMTNCGSLGWVSDRTGYRYDSVDPVSGKSWPGMPEVFLKIANEAATEVGFDNFIPDACLVNRYVPGTKLSLHQDRNERDFSQPIVSVSLGIPAIFLFGGFNRTDKTVRIGLAHGDVVVWGGADRLRYHGVLPLKPGKHLLLGEHRINLTFRKAA